MSGLDSAVLEEKRLGFWLYVLSDVMLFSAFIVTFVVLKDNTAGGPLIGDVISLPFALTQTVILLTSSLFCALAVLSAKYKIYPKTIVYLVLTFSLGFMFLGMEFYEFSKLIFEGHSWMQSAALSGFFGVLGLHGLHIIFGLIWASVLIFIYVKDKKRDNSYGNIEMFGLFWHFLDIVWIVLFAVIYLFAVGGV